MAFKKQAARSPVPASPEALYPILSHGPDAPRELWSRQADVLRAYDALEGDPADVAIELPTGAGKTLVGCLVAEWRRRRHQERVAYVSPTRQLAQQAAAKARLYGIPAVDLTGPHLRWDPADEVSFNRGDAVAFVTYSSVFNSRPYINAETLILDDAHAAEGFVSSNWSVRIGRGELAFPMVLGILARAGALSGEVVRRLRLDTPDDDPDPQAGTDAVAPGTVYLAGIAETAAVAGDLEQALERAVANGHLAKDAAFGLEMVGGSLSACMTYVSYGEILIRPLIAPTAFHDAFADARKRVYMSATLGGGGELERAFGRRRINRIPVPAGWETQGTGRRFFVFPDLLRGLGDEESIADFARDAVSLLGKAVIIAQSARGRDKVAGSVVPECMPVWKPGEYAAAPDEFADAPAGVLALANRYDGIDLPDEACRLVILAGLPVGTHLQERFLHDSAGALAVLTERIRTRLTQGAGRATRNSADYAAVLMLGRDVANFCAKSDVQASLHPEIRAEIAFGLENSAGMPAGEARDNLRHFHDQDEDWRDAELEIIASRDGTARLEPPGTRELAAAAQHEVTAVSAAWQGDWAKAIEAAGQALGKLAGGEETRPYQALWHYILASWAVIAARAGDRQRLQGIADAHFADARAAAAGTRWLSGLATSAAQLIAGQPAEAADPLDVAVISQIAASPIRTRPGAKFAALVASVADGLAQDEAKPYERALAGLGELAGATVLSRGGADAEPDSVWMFGSRLWVAFEAKTGCGTDGELSAKNAREADSHLNYAGASVGGTPPPASFAVVVSPQEAVHGAAAKVSGPRLYLVPPAVIGDIGARLTAAWEGIRIQTRGMQPAEAEPVIADVLSACQALPSQWLPRLTVRRVADG
ncbi:DEAD/DEAH box helicase [Trebonia kvetii]|uniref:DEAD/DEAH box helicase n=1 Tax=Trebonia kvetii TaxID=2480626 RepID=A0A6P2C4Z4_9ACTN|nr:DEAD/DEAH box helicase [Trebonia kvetii]TVZ06318.1 DEAD/DEAH box helicase [Trebonia kvetii]